MLNSRLLTENLARNVELTFGPDLPLGRRHFFHFASVRPVDSQKFIDRQVKNKGCNDSLKFANTDPDSDCTKDVKGEAVEAGEAQDSSCSSTEGGHRRPAVFHKHCIVSYGDFTESNHFCKNRRD